MSRKEMCNIDGNKLAQEIISKGFTLSEASKQIGRDSGYLAKTTREGKISYDSITYIKDKFGINPSLFKSKNSVPRTLVEKSVIKETKEIFTQLDFEEVKKYNDIDNIVSKLDTIIELLKK